MKKRFLATSAVAALAISLIGSAGAVAHDNSGGRNPTDRVEKIKAITDAIGIDSETLKTKRQSGQSLATISGDKLNALMAALLAFDTKKIDSMLESGKINATKASDLKANLNNRVTEVANRIGKKVQTEKIQSNS